MKIDRECEWCGRRFTVTAAEIERGRGRFCSNSHAKLHHWASVEREVPKYLYRRDPDHPLATTAGVVLVHRATLYDKIGPGPHCCHWCGKEISWHLGVGEEREGSITVDHLDRDGTNNDPVNLVPACRLCNWNRHNPRRIRDDEPMVVIGKARFRAVEQKCEQCGETFLAYAKKARRFCSKSCALKHRHHHK
jgi:hypothetical protein